MFKKILLILTLTWAFSSAYAEQTIRFAMEATYPPFESINEKGQIQGFDVDIASALCEELKAKCEFNNQPWNSLIPSLKLGKFDALISAMTINSKRAQQVAFTKPYYFNSVSYVVLKDAKIDITPSDLAKITLGVQGGSSLETYIHKAYGNNINVKTYASINEAFIDLKAGRLDMVLADTPVVKAWIENGENHGYRMINNPVSNPEFFGDGFGIAVNKKNKTLLEQLNQAIDAIKKNGRYDKIYKKYFDGVN